MQYGRARFLYILTNFIYKQLFHGGKLFIGNCLSIYNFFNCILGGLAIAPPEIGFANHPVTVITPPRNICQLVDVFKLSAWQDHYVL
jgi:hypothetical protein